MWREMGGDFEQWDSAGLAALRSALEAHQRARQARLAIDKDGQVWRDRFGQLRPHPLLAVERDARAAFLAALRTLRLLDPEESR